MKLKKEVIHAAVGLKNNIGFTFTFVFTLTLTLSLLIAAFNLNNVILLKSLPYKNAENLFLLKQKTTRNGEERIGSQIINVQFESYKKQAEIATSAITYNDRGILTSQKSEPRLNALYTSYEWFDLLSVPMLIGKGFSQAKDLKDTRAEVVISYDTWQTYFMGQLDIIGQNIKFDDNFYTVVGVVDNTFVEPSPFYNKAPNDIYLPISKSAAYQSIIDGEGDTNTSNLFSLIKVADNTKLLQVQSQFSRLFQDTLASTYNNQADTDIEIAASLFSLEDEIKGDSYHITLMIFAGAVALLFIALVNIINLYFSHVAKKRHTLAICASVGASSKALFKKLFIESTLLTLTSTFYALLLATGLLNLTQKVAQTALPRIQELGIDASSIIFSLFTALLLAAILAVLGNRLINYKMLIEHLNSSGKGTSIQVSKNVRNILTTSQTALTALLLLTTAVVISTTIQFANKPLGFNTEHTISFSVDASTSYPEQAQKINLMHHLREHFNQLPQIKSASTSLVPPFRVGDYQTQIYDKHRQLAGTFGMNAIDENYFNLFEHPLLHGRSFSEQEIIDDAKVVVVSQGLAIRLFGKTDVVGEFVYNKSGLAAKIIGVVEDHFNGSADTKYDSAYIYLPWSRHFKGINLKLESNSNISKITVIEQVRQLGPDIRILDYQELTSTADKALYQYKLAEWLAAAFGIFALLLASTGVYGVLNYSTQMRRFELGVRLALGAKQNKLINMVLKEAFTPLFSGLICSLLLGILLYFYLNDKIQLLAQPNWLHIFAAILLLVVTSYIACVLPVRKIIKNDPTKALRNE